MHSCCFNFRLYCRGAHDHYVGLDSSWFSFHRQSFYESLSKSKTGKFHMSNFTLNQLIKILVRITCYNEQTVTVITPMLKCSVTTSIRLQRAIFFPRLCIFLMVHSHCTTLRPRPIKYTEPSENLHRSVFEQYEHLQTILNQAYFIGLCLSQCKHIIMAYFHCRIRIWTRTQIPIRCRYYGKGIRI